MTIQGANSRSKNATRVDKWTLGLVSRTLDTLYCATDPTTKHKHWQNTHLQRDLASDKPETSWMQYLHQENKAGRSEVV